MLEARVLHELQLDAALGGHDRLGEHERGDARVGDPLRQGAAEVRVGVAHLGDEALRLVVVAEREQAGERVQAVGELVGLRAHGVGEAADAVELAHERLEFGAIAQRHHGPEVPSLAVDGHAVGDDHAVAVHEQHVLAGRAAGEHVGEAHGAGDLVDGAPLGVLREVDQAPCFGVDEQDATVRVDDDDALADPVQHRLALVHQRGELVQLEPEGLTLEAPREQQRRDDSDAERDGEPERHGAAGSRTPRRRGRLRGSPPRRCRRCGRRRRGAGPSRERSVRACRSRRRAPCGRRAPPRGRCSPAGRSSPGWDASSGCRGRR